MAFVACTGNGGGTKEQTSKKQENKMKTIQLTKADFLSKVANYEVSPNEWKYLGDKPAIVDFYADWCGPCKMIAPILEELATEYGDSIYIYKVNTEKEQELAAAFGIRSIPSLLFIPMSGQPQMAQGAMPKNSFKEAIDKVLLKK
ncbi:MAG: thioredoxin [Tannerellaceae bacterium]|nr:thioredoxin [Tannerellaceae bacterium]